MRALIIEDDTRVAALVADAIRAAGNQVSICARGDDGLALLGRERFDVIVLDLMIPGLDGLTVLKRLRGAGKRMPVLILTARDDIASRVEGLDLGADDYLIKPFVAIELLARLRAILRRHASESSHLFEIGDLYVNTSSREVRRAGKNIELTVREFAVLECLLRAEGEAVTRTELLQQVWKFQFDPGTNVVDVVIRRLRAKLDGQQPFPMLHTVRGLGYALAMMP